MERRYAALGILIALLSGFSVTAAWRVHTINQILAEMEGGIPSGADTAQRIQSLRQRLPNSAIASLPAEDQKLIRYAMGVAEVTLRDAPSFYRNQLEVSRYQLRITLVVLAVQLAVAIAGCAHYVWTSRRRIASD